MGGQVRDRKSIRVEERSPLTRLDTVEGEVRPEDALRRAVEKVARDFLPRL